MEHRFDTQLARSDCSSRTLFTVPECNLSYRIIYRMTSLQSDSISLKPKRSVRLTVVVFELRSSIRCWSIQMTSHSFADNLYFPWFVRPISHVDDPAPKSCPISSLPVHLLDILSGLFSLSLFCSKHKKRGTGGW
ncbi:hypothetical protein CEXT_500931 [Caerostris extrusa]|uniref:Uncharacterized protein n=1 Tax=Caerostris extrusa TaxID=172846 RepID=A0AAV4XBF6_CAEEX|nr:hypothetical protein CEXT_500931 [Caerostris extrusa]